MVDNQKQAVADRLKRSRSALFLTQKGLCELTGMPLPSLKNYEGAKQIPGGEAIMSLVRAGINANWLLTGEGPMLMKDLVAPVQVAPQPPPAPPPPAINVDAMVQSICVNLQTAPTGESVAKSARKAVEFYLFCLEKGLITPEGQGKGNLKNVA